MQLSSCLIRNVNRHLCLNKFTGTLTTEFTKLRNSIRIYSQVEEVRKKNIVSIKKRSPRRKVNPEPSVGKSGVSRRQGYSVANCSN